MAKTGKNPSESTTSIGVNTAKLLAPVDSTSIDTAAIPARFFAIVLDHLRKVHPAHFPVTAAATTIAELETVGQHNGTYQLLPRQLWRADLKQEKDLINALTGHHDDGSIYEIVEL